MAHERVLLVDDEDDFVAALTERLAMRDLVVDAVSSGNAAIDRVRDRRYDAIILDLAMPGLDGIETLRVMKSTHPEVQVILLTGSATVEKSVEAMKLGAMDFLEKPADIDLLLERIRECYARGVDALEKKTRDLIDEILGARGW